MLELAVTVAPERLDEALDVLALIAPFGVLERPARDGIELLIRGPADDLPASDEVKAAAGGARVAAREVPDDWRARRLLDHAPLVVAGRITVRPEWAPPAGEEGIAADVALGEGSAFGRGTHVTTEMCLDALARLEPAGSLADVGCGTGVIAIAAAMLGWDPVLAADHSPEAIAETASNAALNGVDVQVTQADFAHEPPPAVRCLVANVPPAVHRAMANGLGSPPDVAVLSGFGPDDATAIAGVYVARGMRVADGMRAGGWAALVLRHA